MKHRNAKGTARHRGGMIVAWSCVLLLAALARPVAGGTTADLVIVSKRVHVGLLAAKYPPESFTTYMTGRAIIVDRPQQRTIVDLDRDTATLIDKSGQTYSVMSLEDLKRTAAEVDDSASEARGLVAGQLRQVEIKATPDTTTLLGHKAKKYVMTRGAATTDIWMTEDFSVPEPLQPWVDLGAVLAPSGAALVEQMSKLKGVQLKSESWVLLGDQKQGVTETVTELRKGLPPKAMTEIPAGFRQVPWPGLQQQPGS